MFCKKFCFFNKNPLFLIEGWKDFSEVDKYLEQKNGKRRRKILTRDGTEKKKNGFKIINLI